jgi:hypothetical protein
MQPEATAPTGVLPGLSRPVLVLIGLSFLAIISIACFMTLGAKGSWSFVLPFRGRKLLSLCLVAYSVAVSTVLFQTVTANRILTPSIMGFDALYVLLKTAVVFFLGAPTIVFTLLEAIFPTTEPIVLVSALLHAPFYFYVSYAMLRYLFHDDVITTDEYFATGAAFTVVAWGFAYVFVVVQIMWPDSFVNAEGYGRPWFELLYLSFSTLTSVGLSDIVAVGQQARSVVMVEMMVGVFYIAMVVARMVGLTMMRHRR